MLLAIMVKLITLAVVLFSGCLQHLCYHPSNHRRCLFLI